VKKKTADSGIARLEKYEQSHWIEKRASGNDGTRYVDRESRKIRRKRYEKSCR
jgi:hypothetical protein